MLIEFSVENFLSIKERVTLSMLASEEEGLPFNTMPSGVDEDRLLRSVVLFGANGSGKSNVLKAFEFMVKMVLESHQRQKGQEIHVTPFRLDTATDGKPSNFEIIFIYNSVKYLYGFSVDPMKVYEEYLYEFKNEEQALIFERENTVSFTFTEDEEEQNTLAQRTLPNRLYLSTSTEWNFKKTSTVFEWFFEQIVFEIETKNNWRSYTASALLLNKELKSIILETLRNTDFGIVDIHVTEEFEVKRNTTGQLTLNLEVPLKVQTERLVTDSNGDKKSVNFLLEDESRGTQRMFELLGPWVVALLQGRLLIIDELEISLHPNLVYELIKLFHDPERNKSGAQLIFTTHNTNLLDPLLVRRDQVWFTEKHRQIGSTELFSLYEFDDVEGEDIEKSYIIGRFGAVPLIRSGLYSAQTEDKDNA